MQYFAVFLGRIKVQVVKNSRSLGENLDLNLWFSMKRSGLEKFIPKSAPFFGSFFWTSKKMNIKD